MSPEARNQLLFIAVVVLLLFVLVIRPARKRAQKVSQLQAAMTPGDQVMLTSGIFGTVLTIDDENARVRVDVAEGVVLTVHRGAIAEIVRDVPAEDDQIEGSDPSDVLADSPAGEPVDGSAPASSPPDSSPPSASSSGTGTTTPDTDATTSHDASKRGAN